VSRDAFIHVTGSLIRSKPKTCLTLLIALLLTSQTGNAGPWEIKPRISGNLQYNDNPKLINDTLKPEGAYSTEISLEATVEKRKADSSIYLKPRIRQIYYPDNNFSDLNGTEYFLVANYEKRLSTISWSANFRFDNVRVSTSEDSDPNNPDQSGGGRFFKIDDRVETLSFTPRVTWSITERDFVDATVGATRVDQEKQFSPRADYDYIFAALGYRRALAQRHILGLRANSSLNETERRYQYCFSGPSPSPLDNCLPSDKDYIVTGIAEQEFTGHSINATYEFNISENTDLTAEYGWQKTDIDGSTIETIPAFPDEPFIRSVESDFKSNTYLLQIAHSGLRADWQINASRDVQPSSDGNASDKTQGQASLKYRLTHRLATNVALIYYEQTQQSAVRSYKNKYFRGDVGLSWQMKKDMSLRLNYIHRAQDYDENVSATNSDRSSNTIQVIINYRL